MIYLYLTLTFVVGYFVGNINFARIFSWMFAKKDITTVGSKNPGSMNMLRTRGFKEALLTLLMEAVKAGAPSIGCYFLFETYFPGYGNLAYFLFAFGAIIGHCYPVLYKFKGGKGVACTFGMFIFHPTCWWVALIMFAVCFLLFFFIDYPFIVSMIFIYTLSIYAICTFTMAQVSFWIALDVILALSVIFVTFMHRGNFRRFFTGTENKVHFADKIFKKHKKEENIVTDDTQNVEETAVASDTQGNTNDTTTTD